MKSFVQPGNTVTVAAPYDRLSGEGALVGSLFGVCSYDALSGAPVELEVEGVFDLKKTSAQAWATVGLKIYWDNTAKEATTAAAAGANALIGVNLATAVNPSSIGRVRLSAAFTI